MVAGMGIRAMVDIDLVALVWIWSMVTILVAYYIHEGGYNA
jgi:hypothetical protein